MCAFKFDKSMKLCGNVSDTGERRPVYLSDSVPLRTLASGPGRAEQTNEYLDVVLNMFGVNYA